MARVSPFLLVLPFAVIPLALAHSPQGTPRTYCEDPAEWFLHDYAVGMGDAIGSERPRLFLTNPIDGNLQNCVVGIKPDYDGHNEFAVGGAWLSACDAPPCGDNRFGQIPGGAGSLECLGEFAHHPYYGPFGAFDMIFGGTVSFTVAIDTYSRVRPGPGEPDCGDFLDDASSNCTGFCSVTFPPGSDGTYHVYAGDVLTGATGNTGHIWL